MNRPEDFPFELVPIKKVDVFRSVMHQLDSMISALEPGVRLGAEREIAERLGVSRVTVREALRVLEGMGRIQIRRNSGSYVTNPRVASSEELLALPAELDAAYIDNIAQVRVAIECQIVNLAAVKGSSGYAELRRVLENTHAQIKDSKSRAQGSLDLSFEAALGRTCGNPLLARYQNAIHATWIEAWLRLGGAVGSRRRFYNEHLRILEAMEDGDVPTAVKRMAEHVDPHAAGGPLTFTA